MTLRELRELRELSLLDVERTTGIHRGTLSKIERGIEVPKPEQLVQLSERYGVDPAGWKATIVYIHVAPERRYTEADTQPALPPINVELWRQRT